MKSFHQKCHHCDLYKKESQDFYYIYDLDQATCQSCYSKQFLKSSQYKKNRIKLYPEIVEVIPYLYLSNQDAAISQQVINSHHIRSVCAIGYFLLTPFEQNQEYKRILVGDYVEEKIEKYFEDFNEWVSQRIERKKNVLVHCSAGVSRSVSFIIAFLIGKKGYKFNQAINIVLKKRPEAHPNEGFIEQLKGYQQKIYQTKQLLAQKL